MKHSPCEDPIRVSFEIASEVNEVRDVNKIRQKALFKPPSLRGGPLNLSML